MYIEKVVPGVPDGWTVDLAVEPAHILLTVNGDGRETRHQFSGDASLATAIRVSVSAHAAPRVEPTDGPQALD